MPVSETTTDDAGLLYGARHDQDRIRTWRKSRMWGKIGPRL